MQPRFGHDFSHVRVHIDALAAESATAVSALAYTVGPNVVFGAGQYRPGTNVGDCLVAHELVHVIQQGAEGFRRGLQRYGDPIPTVAHPTVTTMRQFIDLVRRFEAANPVLTALAIAQRIMRSKYHSRGFDWLLPSTSATPGVAPSAAVTAADVTTLSGEFTVTLPQGGETDPSHIVVAIVAAAETQAPGAGGAGGTLGRLVQSLPAGLSQLDVASWAGDPGSAAAEWMAAHPLPNGGTTKQAYMEEYSPQSDMIGDIDGVAMALAPALSVFQFNHAEPLSNNLEQFYFPRVPFIGGKDRRFHIFCAVEGFALAANNVTLSSSAIANIDNRIHLFATWFTANDPNIQSWMLLNSPSSAMGMSELPSYNPIWSDWVSRGDDWHWFAQQFRAFLQRNLAAEGA
jgi:hypothetical protein